jgi:hypothetical protein
VPKIAIYQALIFYIVSFDLSERLHVHVFSKQKGRNRSAKIWLDDFSIFEKGQLTEKELSTAQKLVEQNKDKISNLIEDFRSGKKVKPLQLTLTK